MSCIASIIIPTHNRSASLKKLLEKLHEQTFSLRDIEVIVVADGCRDNTVEMVKNFQSQFQLLLTELNGLGAASARNTGAALASGKWLLFLDDDMEPCKNFIERHIAAHSDESSVVIGYSPLVLEKKANAQRMSLRHWWEDKFQEMRNRHHRFNYSDLTSGNFSIAASFFRKLGGFDSSMKCREDYEFGFRLIEAGGQFQFAYEAVAFHNDEATNFHRSLQRKREEGRADVQMGKLHPRFKNKTALHYLNAHSFVKAIYIRLLWYAPALCDVVASLAEDAAVFFQKIRAHGYWRNLNYRLHEYWYLRGLFEKVEHIHALTFMMDDPVSPGGAEICTVDLKEGLQRAEEKINKMKPSEIMVFYGKKEIGRIPCEAGYESLKGIHLRKILKQRFTDELYSALQVND